MQIKNWDKGRKRINGNDLKAETVTIMTGALIEEGK